MILPEFDYVTFTSLDDTLDFLARHGDESKVIAGGTDLMIELARGEIKPHYIVNLLDIEELKAIHVHEDRISIGPAVTHTELAESPILHRFAPVLPQGAGLIGSPQIRNQGTIGGNIGNASPGADTVPALMVLNSQLKVIRRGNERWIPLADFFLSPHQTALAGDELIAEIAVEKLPEHTPSSFQRVARRRAMDIAQMSVAVVLFMGEDGECIHEARIAPGSVTPRPVRIREAEMILQGQRASDQLVERAASEVSDRAIDETDLQWLPAYKKPALKVLVIRAIKEALGSRGHTK
jgi:xanthine dehydrogenase FAD-binding subunit